MNFCKQWIFFAGLSGLVLLCPSPAYSSWWLPEAKIAYIKRCTAQVAQQNIHDPTGMCVCVADALEEGFKQSEYNLMMQSQPNPNGSSSDRRMYAALEPCLRKYLK